jgi:NADH:ubiquinone reductase (H+-translocating)
MKAQKRSRVVILGAGFGGVYAAQHLEKLLGRRDDFEISLVNKENYFVFQPMLPEVVSGSIGLLDTVSPLRRLLPRTDIHVREIESIDLTSRTVVTSPGFRPHPHVIAYDYLVLALGNVTDFRGLRGLPEHALPFKNLADALRLRNHVIRALEEASIEADDELRRQLLTFVVAGGGFSGVEVVAELNDFVRGVARSYRKINPAELRVILLHSGDRILPEMTDDLAQFAQRLLKKRGVDIRLRCRLEAATGQEAILSNGEPIMTKTIVSTVPSSPHPILERLDLAKGKNARLIVDRSLRVDGTENVWAIGDCALVPTPDGAGVCPPTAQHALRQGRTVAHNVVAAIRGGEPKRFDFNGLGQMGALGHHSAVAQILGVKLSGFIAWWLWRTIYLMKLPGWGRRLKVATSWTLDLLLPAELVELRLTGAAGIMQEHFEPGEEVFHEGDLGDRVYIITSGRAAVMREADGGERVIAQLGPGECFGEMALLSQSARNATVRCVAAMDVLSLPKREFGLLAANLPDLRRSFERVAEQRNNAVTRA